MRILLITIACMLFFLSCSSDGNDCHSNLNSGVFTDPRDGQAYKFAEIGCQTWMAENLNYKTPKSICYEEKQDNCDKYGKLYTQKEAMYACPKGWHLPSNEEFKILNGYVGEYGGKIGEKLRATDANGTDDYGFAALLGGYGDYNNSSYVFYDASQSIALWSKDEIDSDNAFGQYILNEFITGLIGGDDKRSLFSVRCIRD